MMSYFSYFLDDFAGFDDEELLREGFVGVEGLVGVDGLLGVTLPEFALYDDELLGVTVGRGAGVGVGFAGAAGVTVFLCVVVGAGEGELHCDVFGFAGVVGVEGLDGVVGVTVFLFDFGAGVVNVVELLYFVVVVVGFVFVVVVFWLFVGVVK